MADYEIKDVPVIPQGHLDMACWFFSASMIYKYQTSKTLGAEQVDQKLLERGVDLEDCGPALAKVGFKPLGSEDSPIVWHEANIYAMLKQAGPIWCAGTFGKGDSHHVIVLTGIVKNKVYFNDPWGIGSRSNNSVAWFAQHMESAMFYPIMRSL
jgi:hypothetical protein